MHLVKDFSFISFDDDLSLQVTGKLRDDLTSWDALRAALPVGTVSGAPKVLYFLKHHLSSILRNACTQDLSSLVFFFWGV